MLPSSIKTMLDSDTTINGFFTDTNTALDVVGNDVVTSYSVLIGIAIFMLAYYYILKILRKSYQRAALGYSPEQLEKQEDEHYAGIDHNDDLYDHAIEYESAVTGEQAALRRNDTFRAKVYKHRQNRIISSAARKKFL